MGQDNSDPLPYTQVDRAVKPKAALLAGAIGVTTQHALGSLVEFWDLCGDPRTLEGLLVGGVDEVLLPRAEVVRRFEIASGKTVAPELLASLGLLEGRGDLFRVRGMSRYFAPLRRRVQARRVARAGGLASAKAREGRFGSSNPRSQLGSHELNQGGKQTGTEREPAREPEREPTCEAVVNGPVNTAVSGQRSSGEEASAGKKPPADPRLRELTIELATTYGETRGEAYLHGGAKDTLALKALLPVATDEEIRARWLRGLAGVGWLAVSTFAQLRQKWNDLAAPTEPVRGAYPDPNSGIIRGAS